LHSLRTVPIWYKRKEFGNLTIGQIIRINTDLQNKNTIIPTNINFYCTVALIVVRRVGNAIQLHDMREAVPLQGKYITT